MTLWVTTFLGVGALAAIYALGPREPVDLRVDFDAAAIGDDPAAYLASVEAAFPDLRPEATKTIVWADPAARSRTELAIVYVHGFSATREELRPVPDLVANALGANLHFTRLAGHGRSEAAMGEPRLGHWVEDLAEAVAVGRRIADRVVLVGTSTGASLVAWAATQPAFSDDLAGVVLVSPNLGVRAFGAPLLAGPWAEHLARIIIGPERSFRPNNEDHARHWTTRYPSRALLPMAETVRLAATAPAHDTDVPALFVVVPDDRIVRAAAARRLAERWGGPVAYVEWTETEDPNRHLPGGRILSPSTSEALARRIADWIGTLP